MIVVINASLPRQRELEIQRLAPHIQLRHAGGNGEPLPKDLVRDADVIYTAEANFEPADAPRLRWVQTDSAAVSHLAGKPIFQSSIPLSNVSGAYSVAVGECAIGMILALTRRIALGCRYQIERRWPEDYEPFRGEDLYGRTMGIVGYGSVGRHVARLAAAMGMQVLACKRNPQNRRDDSYCLPGMGDPAGEIPRAWFGIPEIAEMFRCTDVAMICLPHTPATEKLIGDTELAALPRHAYVVNVGRGAVVDEAALTRRLQTGALAGAALDVFEREPLPADSPLWSMPNVLVMPHVASCTQTQADCAAAVLIENLRRDLYGEPLVNVVDKKLMY